MPRRYIPTQLTMVTIPAIFEPGAGRSRMNIRHNDSVKAALVRCLELHQKKNVPEHFTWGAHNKYRYGKRSKFTRMRKSRFGKRDLDLVMSGKSKQKFTKGKGKISISGTTYGGAGGVTATMTITWPVGHKEKAGGKPGTITKSKMRDEIERWTDWEQREMAFVFTAYYVEEMRKRIKMGSTVTRKFNSKLSSQGII